MNRRRLLLCLTLLLGVSTTAEAQSPQQMFAPNYFNRRVQPLSPYLNLLNNGNPATNYYYGVRPGTAAGGYLGNFGNPTFNPFVPPQAGSSFNVVDTLDDLDRLRLQPGDQPGMLPTGHAIGFNNTMGYFGSTGVFGSMSSGFPQAGGLPGQRPMMGQQPGRPMMPSPRR